MNAIIPILVALLILGLIWRTFRRLAGEVIDPRSLCVIDGDTIWILRPDRTVSERVRLQNIDAPEVRRPRSRRELTKAVAATEFLRNKVRQAHTATIRRRGKDRYGRTLARIAIDGLDLGRLLIRSGHATRWT